MRVYNGWRQSPRWAAAFRRGRVHVAVDRPRRFTDRDSLQSIRRYIEQRISVDAETAPCWPVRGRRLAAGIGNVLFACPACLRLDAIDERGDTVACRHCGAAWRVDAECRLLPADGGDAITLRAAADHLRGRFPEPWLPADGALPAGELLRSEPVPPLRRHRSGAGADRARPVGADRRVAPRCRRAVVDPDDMVDFDRRAARRGGRYPAAAQLLFAAPRVRGGDAQGVGDQVGAVPAPRPIAACPIAALPRTPSSDRIPARSADGAPSFGPWGRSSRNRSRRRRSAARVGRMTGRVRAALLVAAGRDAALRRSPDAGVAERSDLRPPASLGATRPHRLAAPASAAAGADGARRSAAGGRLRAGHRPSDRPAACWRATSGRCRCRAGRRSAADRRPRWPAACCRRKSRRRSRRASRCRSAIGSASDSPREHGRPRSCPLPVMPRLTHDPYDKTAPGALTTILGEEFDFRVELAGNAFVGEAEPGTGRDAWYVQAGYGRSSFGLRRRQHDRLRCGRSGRLPGRDLPRILDRLFGDVHGTGRHLRDLQRRHPGPESPATRTAAIRCSSARGLADGRHPGKYLVVQSLSFLSRRLAGS